MSTVIFETEKAIFHFDLRDVFGSLQGNSFCDRDAADLVNILESSPSATRRVPSEKRFFGYIVVDLPIKDKDSACFSVNFFRHNQKQLFIFL